MRRHWSIECRVRVAQASRHSAVMVPTRCRS